MKILILIHSLRRGGAERVVLELSQGLQKKGHIVEIVTWLGCDEYIGQEYENIKRTYLIPKEKYKWIGSIPSSSKLLIEKIKQFNPDIIQAHSPNISWLAAYSGLKTPYIHVFHGYGELTRSTSIKNILIQFIYQLAFTKLNSNFATVSNSMLNYASKFVNKPATQIHNLPNGIDLTKFSFYQTKYIKKSSPVISMIGTLCKNKGQTLGIGAFVILLKTFPNAILKIIGEGPDLMNLRSLASVLKINDNIIFMGMQDDIPHLISESDLIWQLSESEAMPMVILESMAIGKPVVGFFVRGVKDVVIHNETGLLAQFGNVSDIAKFSISLLNNIELYSEFSYASRFRVEQNFSIEKMIEKYELTMNKILK